MKINFLSSLLLITAPTLLAVYASDSKKLSHETIEQALQGNEGIRERAQKRDEGRKIQKKGKQVQKTVKEVTGPLKTAGTTAGNLATATGDVHAKMAAAAFRLAISSAQGLGTGIGAILIGVGRYRERSQEILSITEALVEDAMKSEAKIASLEKKQKELLDLDKIPDPSQSSSRLKKLGQGLSNVYEGRTDIQRKMRVATDIFTDAKAKREEKLKEIQAALKTENENYLEIIRVLQIKLLQETIKEIDRKLDIDKTINKLTADQEFYKIAKKNISSKDKSLAKKELEKIAKEEARTAKELAYYQDLKLRKSPELEAEKLEKDKDNLIAKINELVPLTKLGGSVYLQEKGVDAGNLVRRETIVGLYQEIDKLKGKTDQIDDLKKRLDALEKVITDNPALVSASSTGEPVSPQLRTEESARRASRRR
jgi:hypothetical protein